MSDKIELKSTSSSATSDDIQELREQQDQQCKEMREQYGKLQQQCKQMQQRHDEQLERVQQKHEYILQILLKRGHGHELTDSLEGEGFSRLIYPHQYTAGSSNGSENQGFSPTKKGNSHVIDISLGE